MHTHAVALHFMHYNFAKVDQTLRVTPAMEAGVSDHLWSIEEIVGNPLATWHFCKAVPSLLRSDWTFREIGPIFSDAPNR